MVVGEYLAALILLVQADEFADLCKKYEEAFRDVPAWEADWIVERTAKFEDAGFSLRGRVWGKVGTVLTEESEGGAKPIRIRIEGGQAIRVVGRRAEIYDLERYCFAAAFLREGLVERLREDWDIGIATRPEESKLPELRTKEPGVKPKAPDVVLPGGKPRANALLDVESEVGKYIVLDLKPKKESLKSAVENIRLFVHKDTYRIEKIAVDDPMEVAVYRISAWRRLEKVSEERFQMDISNLEKVVK